MKTQAILAVIRDLGLIVVGLGGIVYQQVTNRVSIELLVVYTVILGVPGTIGLLQLFRGSSATLPTAESPSPSPPPSSSSASS